MQLVFAGRASDLAIAFANAKIKCLGSVVSTGQVVGVVMCSLGNPHRWYIAFASTGASIVLKGCESMAIEELKC